MYLMSKEFYHGLLLGHLKRVFRLTQGGGGRGLTKNDVVNDEAKSARVRVEGIVNGVSFMVERTAKK